MGSTFKFPSLAALTLIIIAVHTQLYLQGCMVSELCLADYDVQLERPIIGTLTEFGTLFNDSNSDSI